MCYYFNSNNAGSVSDFTSSLGDYGTSQPSCYEFRGAGTGQHRCIKNAAASVWNRSSKIIRIYFNSNYAGPHQDFAPGAKGNLNATLKNQNASHQFLPSAPPPPPPPPNICPHKEDWQTKLGFVAHVKVSFRASDLCNGQHIKQVYVHLHNSCPLQGDRGRAYSFEAASPWDTTLYTIEDSIVDSVIPNCDVISNWGKAQIF